MKKIMVQIVDCLDKISDSNNTLPDIYNFLLDIVRCLAIILSLVMILLGQHCTDQNPMQYCPKGSRQPCTRKNPVLCHLNTARTILHR